MKTPPYRIETQRLHIRCYSPADAPLLQRAVTESVAHLLPFMPWAAAEPEPLEAKVERLRYFRAGFDQDRDFVYGIFDPQETRLLGGTGLHTRLAGNALEIGYWIHADFTRQGFATEAAAVLTKVAFEICQVERMEIHCAVENIASAGVPRKLGYVHEGNRRRLAFANGQPADSMIWTMFREEYLASPCAPAQFRAFDAAGRPIQNGE
ncbi:MAG: N-acetyltransferase [Anaerolineae bacterium CG_4_9_14_3_um_filter_57_17]|nr:GNAT family N-acetyltransferase [bacterium]OIO85345.1 MAG: hypothetical protein AUK01_06385 [Anaerolineae bacterium CG2_30_57_67]PJB66307.1 MAG: N-acetyltransferase [Anaerolineae bacterium CG_4_9_14_3_um_filter_57_17]